MPEATPQIALVARKPCGWTRRSWRPGAEPGGPGGPVLHRVHLLSCCEASRPFKVALNVCVLQPPRSGNRVPRHVQFLKKRPAL